MALNGHSKVGASTCERWWNCPGSNALIAKLPPADPTRYAAEGTVAHKICEGALKTMINHPNNAICTCMGHVGCEEEVDDFVIPVTEEMAECAQLYQQTIRDDAYRIGCLECKRIKKEWVNIEQNLKLSDIDAEAMGTNDASIFVPGETLIIYDFKYGQGIPISAEHNKQMLYYCAGVAGDKLMDFKSIELVIIQPRVKSAEESGVKRWVTTPEYVAQFKKDLRAHIAETRNPEAKTETGKWCRFCSAKMICPAMRDKTYEVAKIDFTQPTEKTSIKRPNQLSKTELKLFLDNVELFEEYIADVKAYAFKVLDNGGSIDGYKLVRSGKTHRKWNDTDENVALMLEMELGLSHEQLYTSSIKTPAQIEKLFKGAEKKTAIDVVSAYSYKPEGELKLVREDDLREKQQPGAISDFQAISELGL